MVTNGKRTKGAVSSSGFRGSETIFTCGFATGCYRRDRLADCSDSTNKAPPRNDDDVERGKGVSRGLWEESGRQECQAYGNSKSLPLTMQSRNE